jgi:hypothetical protein
MWHWRSIGAIDDLIGKPKYTIGLLKIPECAYGGASDEAWTLLTALKTRPQTDGDPASAACDLI